MEGAEYLQSARRHQRAGPVLYRALVLGNVFSRVYSRKSPLLQKIDQITTL